MLHVSRFLVFACILLSACNPFAKTIQVTGEQGLERLAENTPILATFRKIDPPAPLEQTIGDVIVQVKQIYFNQNTIAIGFIVKSGSGKRYGIENIALTDPSGAPLKINFGVGLNGSSEDLGIQLPPGESIYIYFFEERTSSKIFLPFEGKFEFSARQINRWREITNLGHEVEIGRFQIRIALPGSEE
jgi:hypothetical protein